MNETRSTWHRYKCHKCNSQCKLVTVEEDSRSEWSTAYTQSGGYYLECSSCTYKSDKSSTIDEAENNFNKDVSDDPWSDL